MTQGVVLCSPDLAGALVETHENLVANGLERVRDVYEATHERLWRSVIAFAGDPDIADEAVAEAFAQAVRRGDSLRDVEAWVWRSAFAIARGELSRRRPPQLSERDDPAETPPEYTRDAIAVLSALDLRDREVLVLRYVVDLTHAEIARRCGITPAAVRVRLHRARSRARRLLEEHDA
jgi:RNA polymerase sigma factor (sigma-70 family)